MHRDLKPHNILLNEVGNALICDLGTAKNMTPGALNYERTAMTNNNVHQEIADATGITATDTEAAPANMTTMTGTPMYMAPETFVSASYTNAVDVWSYGVLLVRLFTLESPYPRTTTAGQLMRCVSEDQLRPIQVERSDLPHPKIKEVIDGCLKFEASERLTFVEVENVLSEILLEMEMEMERESSSGGEGLLLLPLHKKKEGNTCKSNINMTLTLTRGSAPNTRAGGGNNKALMRLLSETGGKT